MTYYTLKRRYFISGQVEWGWHDTRSKDGKIMLFPSREDAEMYRDAYFGPEAVHVHKVVELEVENAAEKPNSYQLMTAIHWWETREQR